MTEKINVTLYSFQRCHTEKSSVLPFVLWGPSIYTNILGVHVRPVSNSDRALHMLGMGLPLVLSSQPRSTTFPTYFLILLLPILLVSQMVESINL